MEYNIIPVIFNLVSIVRLPSQEVALINRLNQFFDFDHNIFLLDSTLDPDQYVDRRVTNLAQRPQSVYTFDNAADDINITSPTYSNEITSTKTFLIVGVENLNFENDSKTLSEIKRIQRVCRNVKIGVFFANNATSVDIIEKLFRWSWSVGIVDIFTGFYSHNDPNSEPQWNVFRFDPFERFELINVTGSGSFHNYFFQRVPNYRLHSLRVVGVANVITNLKSNKNFWDNVVRHFNATPSFSVVSREHLGDIIVNGLKNFPMEDFFFHEISVEEEHLPRIYPHLMLKIVMIVPHAQPHSDFWAYLQNKSWKQLIFYSIIMIMTASLLLIVSGNIGTKKSSPFQSVADVLNLLMNDNMAIKYGQLPYADVCIIVPLTFTGLIVMNGILSIFKSYLTIPIYEHQINTIDELYESRIPMHVNEIYWADHLTETLESIWHYGGWKNRVVGVNHPALRKQMDTFNNSFGIFLFSDLARVYLEAQKRLGLKAYHLITATNLGVSTVHFRANDEFPFIEPINDLIHNLQSAGLMNKWIEEGDETIVKFIYDLNVNRPLSQQSKGSGSDNVLVAVPTVVWYGWSVSLIAFICEIIWSKVQPRIERLRSFIGKL